MNTLTSKYYPNIILIVILRHLEDSQQAQRTKKQDHRTRTSLTTGYDLVSGVFPHSNSAKALCDHGLRGFPNFPTKDSLKEP